MMIEELVSYAHKENIPIMLEDGIDYLCSYIRNHSIKNILEIGSAIGYSAIRMAMVSDDVHVVTIEKDLSRYEEAVNNIKKFDLDDRIDIIYGDALEAEVTGEYDLIFIDASKGHNIDFFNRYKVLLKKDGVIITDNLSFHGLVDDDKLVVTKNQRGIVRKIRNFIEFLNNNNEFITEYIEVGDRISISKRGIFDEVSEKY